MIYFQTHERWAGGEFFVEIRDKSISLPKGRFFMRKEMKSGYTTGSCAAAGTKAAILALQGNVVQEIELYALSGELLHIPIKM